ncbi:hypothetical protein LCL95_01950 [Bacillus timonensis]|nr:hypothetical protein [Bacillus timonensis]
MSSYQEFLNERDKIDYLIQKGYKISGVTENLSGAFVEFELQTEGEAGTNEKEVLHILTADARKYFSSLIIKQRSVV